MAAQSQEEKVLSKVQTLAQCEDQIEKIAENPEQDVPMDIKALQKIETIAGGLSPGRRGTKVELSELQEGIKKMKAAKQAAQEAAEAERKAKLAEEERLAAAKKEHEEADRKAKEEAERIQAETLRRFFQS